MKTLKFLILFMLLYNCTSEPDEFKFTAILTNESGTEATVSFYYTEELVKTIVLNDSEATSCNYLSEFFDNFNKCDGKIKINSITVIFPNGKGYTCNSFESSSEQILCFGESRNLLLGGFNDLGNRQYEFIITEEDFDNAHDLP